MIPPATPSYDSSQMYIIVQLPIFPVQLSVLTPLQDSHDLLDRLCTPPMTWAVPLWHCIHPTAPVDALLLLLQRQKTLIISSDASVDAAKHSCCAWSIYGEVTIWQGKGIVPGNCDDTYSGRSEAFGLLAALMFLQHYLNQFPLTQPARRTQITVYCDNGGTITNATAHSQQYKLFPNQTIADDYDVYHKIGQVVCQLTQFSIVFIHVKGHQNQQPNKRQTTTIHTSTA